MNCSLLGGVSKCSAPSKSGEWAPSGPPAPWIAQEAQLGPALGVQQPGRGSGLRLRRHPRALRRPHRGSSGAGAVALLAPVGLGLPRPRRAEGRGQGGAAAACPSGTALPRLPQNVWCVLCAMCRQGKGFKTQQKLWRSLLPFLIFWKHTLLISLNGHVAWSFI